MECGHLGSDAAVTMKKARREAGWEIGERKMIKLDLCRGHQAMV
jgi:hypothetical protein